MDIVVTGRVGVPLQLEGKCQETTVTVQSQIPLQAAEKRPLTEETLRGQLGRLGETPFELGTLDNRLEGQVIVPVSELNRLRCELVDKMGSPDNLLSGSPKATGGSEKTSIVSILPNARRSQNQTHHRP